MTAPDSPASGILAGIRAIEQAATPGEWKHRTAQTRGDWTTSSRVMPIERVEADARPHGVGIFDAQADAEFTATARAAVPRLVAAVEVVLKLADEAVPVDRDCGGEPIWWNLTPDELREAITAALAGTGRAQPGEDGGS